MPIVSHILSPRGISNAACSVVMKIHFALLVDLALPECAMIVLEGQCLWVRVSDVPVTYRTPTVKFTAIAVYDTVRSPRFWMMLDNLGESWESMVSQFVVSL
jgi:hypothetical protein